MPYATDSDLLLLAPPASGVDVAVRAAVLSAAELLLDEDEIGDTLMPAHAYLTAHLLASTPGSGMPAGVGPITSQRAGEIAATYAAPVVADDYGTSHWGRMFRMFVPIHEGVTG